MKSLTLARIINYTAIGCRIFNNRLLKQSQLEVAGDVDTCTIQTYNRVAQRWAVSVYSFATLLITRRLHRLQIVGFALSIGVVRKGIPSVLGPSQDPPPELFIAVFLFTGLDPEGSVNCSRLCQLQLLRGT